MLRLLLLLVLRLSFVSSMDLSVFTGDDWDPRTVSAEEIVAEWNDTQMRFALFTQYLPPEILQVLNGLNDNEKMSIANIAVRMRDGQIMVPRSLQDADIIFQSNAPSVYEKYQALRKIEKAKFEQLPDQTRTALEEAVGIYMVVNDTIHWLKGNSTAQTDIGAQWPSLQSFFKSYIFTMLCSMVEATWEDVEDSFPDGTAALVMTHLKNGIPKSRSTTRRASKSQIINGR